MSEKKYAIDRPKTPTNDAVRCTIHQKHARLLIPCEQEMLKRQMPAFFGPNVAYKYITMLYKLFPTKPQQSGLALLLRPFRLRFSIPTFNHLAMLSLMIRPIILLPLAVMRMWLLPHKTTLRISRFALPARLEAPDELEAWEDVGFGVDDDGVEGEEVGGGEEEVEVFEGFGLRGGGGFPGQRLAWG